METEVQTSAQEPLKADSQQQSDDKLFYGEQNPEATTTVTPTDEQNKETKVEGETEAKPEETKPPEEFVLKLPENSILDESALKDLTEFAKEKGISKEAAQELVERQDKLLSSFAKAQDEHINNEVKQWAEETKGDKEVGGKNFSESVELAKRVIDRFGTPELKKILDRGLGNNVEAVRLLSRIGKEYLADDKMIQQRSGAKGYIPTEELFYNKGE